MTMAFCDSKFWTWTTLKTQFYFICRIMKHCLRKSLLPPRRWSFFKVSLLIFFQPRTHEYLFFFQGCLSPCFRLKCFITVANIGPTSNILTWSFPFDCSVVIWSFENAFQGPRMLHCPDYLRRAPRKEGFEDLHQALHPLWCSAPPSPCPPSRPPQPLRFSPSLYQPGQR